MKVSRKGIAVILLFVVVIPLLIDALLAAVVYPAGVKRQLAKILPVYYFNGLVLYAIYLPIAFAMIKVWKENNKKK